jgi:hypothetical protein
MEAAGKATPWAFQHLSNWKKGEKATTKDQINNVRQLLSYFFYGPAKTEI